MHTLNHNKFLYVPSTHATCFARIDHPQALNTLYLKLKLKYISTYIRIYIYIYVCIYIYI
jgi:hypothetical protein